MIAYRAHCKGGVPLRGFELIPRVLFDKEFGFFFPIGNDGLFVDIREKAIELCGIGFALHHFPCLVLINDHEGVHREIVCCEYPRLLARARPDHLHRLDGFFGFRQRGRSRPPFREPRSTPRTTMWWSSAASHEREKSHFLP